MKTENHLTEIKKKWNETKPNQKYENDAFPNRLSSGSFKMRNHNKISYYMIPLEAINYKIQ